MERLTIYPDGSSITEEVAPGCGDYCDRCGDCLVCDSEGGCPLGGEHMWVIYAT